MALWALLGASVSVFPVTDVRVGDDQSRTRVEIECAQPCDVEPLDDGSVLIVGATAEFWVDTSAHSQRVLSITMRTTRRGAALTLQTATDPRAMSVKPCRERSICIDFEMAASPPARGMTLAALSADIEKLSAEIDDLRVRRGGLSAARTECETPPSLIEKWVPSMRDEACGETEAVDDAREETAVAASAFSGPWNAPFKRSALR